MKRGKTHFVAADMMGDYLDEHDGEPPHDAEGREQDSLRYGSSGIADIDDIDGIITQMYGDD